PSRRRRAADRSRRATAPECRYAGAPGAPRRRDRPDSDGRGARRDRSRAGPPRLSQVGPLAPRARRAVEDDTTPRTAARLPIPAGPTAAAHGRRYTRSVVVSQEAPRAEGLRSTDPATRPRLEGRSAASGELGRGP